MRMLKFSGGQPVFSIRLSFALFFLGVFITTVSAQQTTALITNVAGRHTTSLNGRWQIIIDPYETGYYDYRFQPRGDGYFKNTKPSTPSDLIEYDFDTSQQLLVPGDWNSQDDKLLFYEGTIWYKKSFNYQKKDHTRLFVYFGGANYLADVYLNGQNSAVTKVDSHHSTTKSPRSFAKRTIFSSSKLITNADVMLCRH